MTLAIGRQGPDGVIRVVADMRLIDHAEIRRGYPYAVLKNIILDPDVLVAYAGNAGLAMHAIRQLQDAPPDRLARGLLASAEDAGDGEGSVDYLLAAVGRGVQRITHRGVEEPCTATWIGDKEAFEAYQQAFHDLRLPEPIRIEGVSPDEPIKIPEAFMRMSSALAHLEQMEDLDCIGEGFVSAFSRSGFRYEQRGFFATSHKQEIGTEWTTLNWGTGAQGSFGYNLLPCTEPGIAVVGLYFPHAGLGLLYHPLAYDDALAYRGVTHDEFRAAVTADHGVDIDGARLT